jgi:hypothetical protein
MARERGEEEKRGNTEVGVAAQAVAAEWYQMGEGGDVERTRAG